MYINKINKEFNIKNQHKIRTFLLIKIIYCYENTSLFQNTHLYQQLIKLINSAVIIIKLNIAFIVLMFSKQLITLSQCYIEFTCKIMHYFDQIKFYLIFLNPKVLCSIKFFYFNNNILYTDNSNTCKSI